MQRRLLGSDHADTCYSLNILQNIYFRQRRYNEAEPIAREVLERQQRVLGSEHRSVYHFKQPPDATPENTLVWMLKLEPGSTRTLEYDFDADVKDVEGENGFEQGA